jgi:hypothetical protein
MTLSTCRFCRYALDAQALQQGLGHCSRSACRAESESLAHAHRRQAAGLQALAVAQQLLPAATARPVLLHLQTTPSLLEPVTQQDREFLVARWQHAWDHAVVHQAPGDDSATTLPPAANALCAHCAGNCCAGGAQQAAFVDHTTLQTWVQAHPGHSLQDAFADYLSRLPDEHIAGQCCYQSAVGCSLPRDLRADTCNRYRCETLDTLGQHLSCDPDGPAVVLTWDWARLQSAGLFQAGQFTPWDGLADTESP